MCLRTGTPTIAKVNTNKWMQSMATRHAKATPWFDSADSTHGASLCVSSRRCARCVLVKGASGCSIYSHSRGSMGDLARRLARPARAPSPLPPPAPSTAAPAAARLHAGAVEPLSSRSHSIHRQSSTTIYKSIYKSINKVIPTKPLR
jgi:hypothetical protein